MMTNAMEQQEAPVGDCYDSAAAQPFRDGRRCQAPDAKNHAPTPTPGHGSEVDCRDVAVDLLAGERPGRRRPGLSRIEGASGELQDPAHRPRRSTRVGGGLSVSSKDGPSRPSARSGWWPGTMEQ